MVIKFAHGKTQIRIRNLELRSSFLLWNILPVSVHGDWLLEFSDYHFTFKESSTLANNIPQISENSENSGSKYRFFVISTS